MNLSAEQASVTADEIAQPLQPHRLSTSCDLHPDERFSGFCPSCLCDRLSVLDHNAVPPPSSSSRKLPTISTAALKALFKPSSSSSSNGNNNNNNNNNASNENGRVRPGFFPELRRTKSFSAKNNEGSSGGFEPQRRSCDVRLRDEHRNLPTKEASTVVVSSSQIEDEARKSSVNDTLFEINAAEEETQVTEVEQEQKSETEIVNDSGETKKAKSSEIIEEEEEEEEVRPMKDYMDLYPQTKKQSVKGSFFSAASVFSKKLQKWRQKQKIKKPRSGDGGGARPQSEIGFGRRSSDTDPRFSLDAGRFSVDIGRISLDDSRYSLDEPRASWDGHLIGRTTAPRIPPPPSMLSVVENAPVNRSDMQIRVEEPSSPSINNESDPIIIIPGGSNQTRDYYNEPPSSRRRKSLDRSSSIRKIATELDDVKSVSNSKVSPATTAIDSNSIETTENRGNENGDKKSRRWGKWSILGFIYRKGVSKDDEEEEEEDRYSRSNSAGMAERSLSESWPELRNGEGGGGGPKMRRSNSNVSWRSTGGGSTKNKSSRYSSKDGENGMLRFYLTPSWRTGGGSSGGGGGGGAWEKTAAKANSHGHSIARRVMRLY